MRTRILGKMLNTEVQEYLQRNDIIIVPVGTTEMHGGFPLDCETVISEAYALKMAEACDGLVLTGLPYFYAGATASGRGTVQVTVRQGIDYLGAIARSLLRLGFTEAEEEIERLKGQIDIAKILGASVFRHDAVWTLSKTGIGRSFDMMLPVISKNARRVTEYAASLGIKTCSENHGFIAQDSDRMERLFNAVAHDNYGLLVDVGNFACVDEDSVLAVSRLAPYAIHVHCKDFKFYPATETDCAPQNSITTRACNYITGSILGEGDIPVKHCLKILKRAAYDGYVSIEFEGKEDCTEGISKGFENLKRYLSEIEK